MDASTFTQAKRFVQGVSVGIHGRLILLLLVVLIPILLIQAFTYYERFQMRRANELQSNLEVARAVGRAFDSFVEQVLHHELAIGIAATVTPPLSKEDLRALLNAAATHHRAVVSLDWVGPDGRVLNSSNPEAIGLDISDRPFFHGIVSGREWVVSDLVLSNVDGQPLFTISRGIRNQQGNLLGVVLAVILTSRLDSVLAIEREKGEEVILTDSKGMLVYRFPHIQVSWEERNWAEILPSAIPGMAEKEVMGTFPAIPYDKRSRLVAITPIRSIGWLAGAGSREERAMRPVTSSLIRHNGIFFSVALGSFLLALFVSRTIASPITALQERANRFRQGMLDFYIEPAGPREVRHLSATLNQMADEIRHWMEETRAQAEQAEEKAREAEEGRILLDALMEHVPEGITIADAPDVRIRMVSRYGRDMIGRAYEGLTMDEAASRWKIYSKDCMAPVTPGDMPVSRAIRRGEILKNAELIYENEKGEQFSLLCNAGPILDGSGRIIGGVGVWRDITEITRMADALRASEHRYRSLFEAMSEGFALKEIICDEQGRPRDYRFLEVNPAFEQQTGLKAEDVIGRTLREILPRAEEVWVERYGRVALTGEPDRFEQWSEPLGRCYNVCAFRTEPGRFATMLLDITERKRAEEALQKAHNELEMRVRERTAELTKANQALMESECELRSLSSRLLQAQEEERKRVVRELHDSVGSCLSAVKFRIEHTVFQMRAGTATPESLEELIPTIQDTTDEARRIYMDLCPSILEDLGILATIRWFLRQFQTIYSGIHIEEELDLEEEDVPEPIKIVIFRIMQEALNNMAKYSKADLVRFSFIKRDSRIKLDIRDNGIGFDLCTARVRKDYSGGMGLTSMRERAHFSGGSFIIESGPGEGTTIHASWPCA